MIGFWARYELLRMGRDRGGLLLLVLSLSLTLTSALDSGLRVRDFEANRSDAARTDREVWVGQGSVNPHSAAHFSRYAFRPVPPLAAFDAGMLDFAGSAVWLEAHHQNPPTLRRADHVGWTSPFAAPTPAWVVHVLGTFALGTLLHGAVARERERGTLALLASLDVNPLDLGMAKLMASLFGVAAFAGVSVLGAVGLAGFVSALTFPLAHVSLLVVAHVLAFSGISFFFLFISASARSERAAFAGTGAAWLAMAVLLPVVAARLGAELHPTPAPGDLHAEIVLRAQDAFWENAGAREAATKQLERRILAETGGDSLEALGFNRSAVELQAHEIFANGVYDEIFGGLAEKHRAQDGVMRWLSLASPVLALSRISSSLSGTNLEAQLDFASKAEVHRRRIIEKLNDDMMRHAGAEDYAYRADASLWERIEDFDPSPRPLVASLSDTRFEWAVLVAWCLLLPAAVLRALRRSVLGDPA